MSTDYSLFVNSNASAIEDIKLLTIHTGVELHENGRLTIEGLTGVYFEAMTARHRRIMAQDYGPYGQDYTWFLTGTYNKESDIHQLYGRLVRCAATLVASRPQLPLALMRSAESFYVLNTPAKLFLSKQCLDEAGVPELFQREFTQQHIDGDDY